jgi:hypothetical protein
MIWSHGWSHQEATGKPRPHRRLLRRPGLSRPRPSLLALPRPLYMCSFAVPSSPRHGAALFFLRLGSSPPFFSYTIRDRALRRRWRIVSADRMRRSLGSFCAVLRPSGASLSPCPTTYTTRNRGSLPLESHRDAV